LVAGSGTSEQRLSIDRGHCEKVDVAVLMDRNNYCFRHVTVAVRLLCVRTCPVEADSCVCGRLLNPYSSHVGSQKLHTGHNSTPKGIPNDSEPNPATVLHASSTNLYIISLSLCYRN
jgi:hypothetical protein